MDETTHEAGLSCSAQRVLAYLRLAAFSGKPSVKLSEIVAFSQVIGAVDFSEKEIKEGFVELWSHDLVGVVQAQ